ncbi:hypothetical protein DCE93_09410 [Agromyces badenianii]|uniref:DUF4190 domain-containing protein n=1 Tax=Agromyces badenianii TaxID=2080742 RepID=A0A2S0WX18_9MICO|nr:hypothetical protein [Agromyces badenianii]AWB95851.1 hypothetical protein DCE93_09410 [Agromyces badenianii]
MSSGSAGRGASGRADGRRYAWIAIIAVVLAAAALFAPAIAALPLSALAVVLGLRGRREMKNDPTLVAGWLWIGAVAVGGFVLLFQVILVVLSFATTGG